MADKTETADMHRLEMANQVFTGHGEVPFIVVPEGFKMQDLESLQEKPRRVREVVKMTALESFSEYVKAWRNSSTIILANDAQRSLEAVIDYHNDAQNPSWAAHRVQYKAELSREALAWQGKDGKSLAQMELAEFLEEHVGDVVNPPGAQLLEQSLKLQILRKVVFGSVARLQSGEFQLNYSQENEQGTVELPEKIELGIPLFHKGKSYKITARLRYRLNEGAVSFTYKLDRWQESLEHAFDTVVADAIEGTKSSDGKALPVYRGSRS